MGISFDETLDLVVDLMKTQTTRLLAKHHHYKNGGVYGPTNKPIYAPNQIVSATAGATRGKDTVFVQLQPDGSLRQVVDENSGLKGSQRIAHYAKIDYQPLSLRIDTVEKVDVRGYQADDALREGLTSLPEFWAVWLKMHDPFIAERVLTASAFAKLAEANDIQTERIRAMLRKRPDRHYAAWRIRFTVMNTLREVIS